MKGKLAILCWATSIWFITLSVQAQELESQNQPLNLGEVVVTATKTERVIEDVPASVTLIKKEDIEKTTARYVDDVLRNEAGIDVDRGKGGLSSPSTHVRMRGFSHGRAVVVMRDGVPINRAICGGAKWDEIPVDIVEKIEVVRGTGSSLYGSGAMGGVINIFTKQPEKKLKVTLEEGYGTYNTWESNTAVSGPLGENFGYVLSYNHLETDGFIPYCGTDAVFRKASIDNYREADNVFAKLVYDIDDASSLSLTHSYWDDEVSMGRKYNHMDLERNRTILGYKKEGETFNITANLFYLDEEFVSYMDHKMYDSCNKLAQVRHRPGKDTGFNLSLSFPLTENQIFTTGIDYRWAKMKDIVEGKFAKPKPPKGIQFKDGEEKAEGKQHRASLFLEDEINFDKLMLNLSVRNDWYKSYDGYHYKKVAGTVEEDREYSSKDDWEFNPKIGAVYHLSEATTLRGSIGRAFQMPYLYSLYATTECPPGKENVGNPDLDPEYTIGYELGIDQKIGENATIRLTGFYNDIDDYMETPYWKTASGRKQYKWSNIDEVETAGIELEGEYKVTDNLSLFANYTYLETEINKFNNPPGASQGSLYTSSAYKGNELPDQARHKVNWGLTYSNPKILTVSLKCRYVGSRWDDLENTKKLEPYLTADLLLSRKITDFMELSLEINDLFDESWQEDYGWFASSGRTFMGRVKWVF